MTSSIEKIIELDKQARQKVSDANRRAREIIEEAEAEKSKMGSDYSARVENRLEIVKDSFGKMAEDEIAKIEADKESAIARLDESMNSHRAEWEKEILAAIIG